MIRPRACGALIRDGFILMVRHVEPDRSFWTLPGGGVEASETPEQAVVREVREETGLQTHVVKLLFESTYGDNSPEFYYLMAMEDDSPEVALGFDPEEAHLPDHERQLQGADWRSLEEMSQDCQVSAVLRALV